MPNGEYPGPRCPLRSSCLPQSNCTAWQHGAFNWSMLSLAMYQLPKLPDVVPHTGQGRVVVGKESQASCVQLDQPGSWYYGHWKYSKAAKCSLHHFYPHHIHECLAGKRVLFIGDSIARQKFSRLVALLRNFPEQIERYHHVDSIYRSNSTHDLLLYLPHSTPDAFKNSTLASSTIKVGDQPLDLEIGFLWTPKSIDVQRILSYKPTTIIATLAYHKWESKDLEQGLRDLVSAAVKAGQASPPSLVEHIFWTAPPRKANDDKSARKKMKEHNDRMRDAVQDLQNTTAGSGLDLQILPMDKMADGAPFTRLVENSAHNQDGMHWGCAYHPDWPSDIEFVKMPANMDCRDLMNYNILQVSGTRAVFPMITCQSLTYALAE